MKPKTSADITEVSEDSESEDPQERGEPPQPSANAIGSFDLVKGRPYYRLLRHRIVAIALGAVALFGVPSILSLAGFFDGGVLDDTVWAQDSSSDSDFRPQRSRHRWPGVPGTSDIDERIDEGIRRGLKYLKSRQTNEGRLSPDHSVAVTALGGMAFLGYGAEYLRGEHGVALYDMVRYLTLFAMQDRNGYIHEGSGIPSKMHGHAYAVLFLAQVLGSIDTPAKETEVKNFVGKGVACIEETQSSRGGWYYRPKDSKYDMDEASITVCCLQALRAAKDAGFMVNKLKIDRAVSYLKESSRKQDGAFVYSLSQGDRSRYSFELTAAAISTLDAAGKYTGDVHNRGVEYLRGVLDKHRRKPLDASPNYPFYGGLYVAQAFHQLGGDIWEDWSGPAMEQLLDEQEKDGNWKSRFGNAYATAMALLILEVPRGYLPIFER